MIVKYNLLTLNHNKSTRTEIIRKTSINVPNVTKIIKKLFVILIDTNASTLAREL